MIGRNRAHRAEERAPLLQRGHERGGPRDVPADSGRKRIEAVPPAGGEEVHHTVGSEGRAHVARPAGRTDRPVAVERVGRVVRRAERLDSGPLEEDARPELRAGELRRQLVVHGPGVVARERLVDPEHLVELMGQPQAGRCRPEEEKVVGKELPGATVVGLGRGVGRTPVSDRNPECLERDPLRVEHPQDVMVRDNEQIRGCPEGRVRVGKESRVDVAVRADDREAGDAVVELAGDQPLGGIWREKAAGCQGRSEFHGHAPHAARS